MWISMAIGLPTIVAGAILLRHDETASIAFVMAVFVLTIMLRHTLDDRRLRQIEQNRASRAVEVKRGPGGALLLDPKRGEGEARRD
jgi:hypothetical protein